MRGGGPDTPRRSTVRSTRFVAAQALARVRGRASATLGAPRARSPVGGAPILGMKECNATPRAVEAARTRGKSGSHFPPAKWKGQRGWGKRCSARAVLVNVRAEPTNVTPAPNPWPEPPLNPPPGKIRARSPLPRRVAVIFIPGPCKRTPCTKTSLPCSRPPIFPRLRPDLPPAPALCIRSGM